MRDLVKNAINAADANGKYAFWVSVGALKTDATCDCEEEPPQEGCINLAADQNGWFAGNVFAQPTPDFGNYQSGLGPSITSPLNFFWLWETPIEHVGVTSITFKHNQAITGLGMGRLSLGGGSYSGPATNETTFDNTTHPGQFPMNIGTYYKMYVTTANNQAPSSGFRITEVCLTYE
jgi:hypothetical protein